MKTPSIPSLYSVLKSILLPPFPDVLRHADSRFTFSIHLVAADRLLVEGKCYATFGNYILTSDIFGYVGHQIDEKERRGDLSETDLTSAFSDAAGRGRLLGVLIEGQSYDIGLPEKYVETFMEYGM